MIVMKIIMLGDDGDGDDNRNYDGGDDGDGDDDNMILMKIIMLGDDVG